MPEALTPGLTPIFLAVVAWLLPARDQPSPNAVATIERGPPRSRCSHR